MAGGSGWMDRQPQQTTGAPDVFVSYRPNVTIYISSSVLTNQSGVCFMILKHSCVQSIYLCALNIVIFSACLTCLVRAKVVHRVGAKNREPKLSSDNLVNVGIIF